MRVVPFLLFVTVLAFPAMVSSATTLDQLRDHSRPLLVFAATANDPLMRAQLDIVKAEHTEARERDLIAIAVVEHGSPATETRLSDSEAVAARERYHVSAGEFIVVLIGKDGGEKLRSHKPIPFSQLRSTIDSMPMRKDEMKSKPS